MSNSAALQFDGAEAMFNAGATVISHLIDKQVTGGAVAIEVSQTSLKPNDGWVILLTEIPSASTAFTIRFEQSAILEIVKLMMGGGQDLGAIGDSMTAEITAQIATTIAEELATKNGWSTAGIFAKISDDPGRMPVPPLTTVASTLAIAGSVSLKCAIDFDGPTAMRCGVESVAGAPAPAAAAAAPAAAPAAAAPAAANAAPEDDAPKPKPQRETTQVVPAKPNRSPQAASFSQMTPSNTKPKDGSLELVHDVPMTVRALLGSSRVQLRDVCNMSTGTVFELNRSSEEPIDLFVNNVLIARGEVVVVEDRYAVKIRELNPEGAPV